MPQHGEPKYRIVQNTKRAYLHDDVSGVENIDNDGFLYTHFLGVCIRNFSRCMHAYEKYILTIKFINQDRAGNLLCGGHCSIMTHRHPLCAI